MFPTPASSSRLTTTLLSPPAAHVSLRQPNLAGRRQLVFLAPHHWLLAAHEAMSKKMRPTRPCQVEGALSSARNGASSWGCTRSGASIRQTNASPRVASALTSYPRRTLAVAQRNPLPLDQEAPSTYLCFHRLSSAFISLQISMVREILPCATSSHSVSRSCLTTPSASASRCWPIRRHSL